MLENDVLYIIKTENTHGHTDERVIALADGLPGRESKAPLCITRAETGKPYFKDTPESLHFSVTHSGEFWCCLFSRYPVGLDLQRIPGHKDFPRIARRYFHPVEVHYLEENGWEKFPEIWCAKESYVKYTGKGIAGGLGRFSVIENNQIKKEIEGIPLRMVEGFPRYKCFICGGALGELRKIYAEDPVK